MARSTSPPKADPWYGHPAPLPPPGGRPQPGAAGVGVGVGIGVGVGAGTGEPATPAGGESGPVVDCDSCWHAPSDATTSIGRTHRVAWLMSGPSHVWKAGF